MIKLVGALLVASVTIQYLNYLFIKLGSHGEGVLFENFKLILLTMPLQVIASLSFVYFYSQGVKENVSYFFLSIGSVSTSLIMSWLITMLFLNGRAPTTIELLACFLTLSGIGLFVYAKSLS